MPRYHVHTYAVVRVKVSDVEASSAVEASKRADELLDLRDFRFAQIGGACEVEWAADICDYVVDTGDGIDRESLNVDKHHRPL